MPSRSLSLIGGVAIHPRLRGNSRDQRRCNQNRSSHLESQFRKQARGYLRSRDLAHGRRSRIARSIQFEFAAIIERISELLAPFHPHLSVRRLDCCHQARRECPVRLLDVRGIDII